ncbi:MAG: peptide ABC transporter [Acidobacteria bacterium]|nr:peptide ABC transporter [Acidobacteriota bacterium]
MLETTIRKLGSVVVVMLLVAVIVFTLIHLAPGDPAAIIAGDNATAQQIDAIRERLGMNAPLPMQFLTWALAVLKGDMGISIFSGEPVLKLIGERLFPTLSLALLTMAASVVIAVAAGMFAALKAGSWSDRLIMALSVIGFSAPVFVVGYLLIYVFAIKLHLLPVQGYDPLSEGFWAWLSHLILPAITLGFVYVALIARMTRASVMEILESDFIRTARAKGVGTFRILWRHALRNAGVTIVTVVGLGLALLIGGVVVTESVFNIPGVGRLVVDAIDKRDYPIIQGVTLLFSAVYVFVNLAIDLSYVLIDPRLRRK